MVTSKSRAFIQSQAKSWYRMNKKQFGQWRKQVLNILPLETVYGDYLLNKKRGLGWRACRDPFKGSYDRNPSAGVADGTGRDERGTFHSFHSGKTMSVFDFMVENGQAVDFQDAIQKVAEYSGVPQPKFRLKK